MIDKTLTEIQKLSILEDVSFLLVVRITSEESAKEFVDMVISMSD